MLLQQAQKIIDAFATRYLPLCSDDGDFLRITSYEDKEKQVVEFTRNDYSLIAWLDDTEELHIVSSANGRSVFEFAEEHGLTEADVNYIRFGRSTFGKTIHEDGSFTDYSYGKIVMPSNDFMNMPD